MTLYPARLTVEQVEVAVTGLVELVGDDEAAHGEEDTIHAAVLEAIAIGQLQGVDAQRAALIALSTRDLNFARWCA